MELILQKKITNLIANQLYLVQNGSFGRLQTDEDGFLSW